MGGWGELYPIFLGIFLTLQSPLFLSMLVFCMQSTGIGSNCRIIINRVKDNSIHITHVFFNFGNDKSA